MRYFAVDLNASQIAQLTSVNRNTVNRYLHAIRRRIVEYCEIESREAGKSTPSTGFFIVRRRRGEIGARNPTRLIILGRLTPDDHVTTRLASPEEAARLQAAFREKIKPDRIVYLREGTIEEHGLEISARIDVLLGGRSELSVVESFWGFAKNRLMRLRQRPTSAFELHLREREFRFNHRGDDLYRLLLRSLELRRLF